MQAALDVHEVLSQVAQNNNYKTALNRITSLAPTRIKILMSKSPSDIRRHLARRNEDFHSQQEEGRLEESEKCKRWGKHESLAFEWLVACHCFLRQLPLQQSDNKTLQFVSNTFPLKDPTFLKYELKTLATTRSAGRCAWSENQGQLLVRELRGRQQPYQWGDVALEVYRSSEESCFKLPKACKEFWTNYMNPTVNREGWAAEEDHRLLLIIKEYGERWAFAARLLDTGRTEHMVKNRFMALKRKYVPKSKQKERSRCIQTLVQKTQTNLREAEQADESHEQSMLNLQPEHVRESVEEEGAFDGRFEGKKESQGQEEASISQFSNQSLFNDERCFDIEAILLDRCENNNIEAEEKWKGSQAQNLGQVQLFSDWDFDFLDRNISLDRC